MTRQMAFDFELKPSAGPAVVRRSERETSHFVAEIQEMFLRAVRLEENPDTVADAKATYQRILDLQPTHAAAAINLGTISYNERDFDGAELLYRRATESDPDYALAFFDLGNVLDELHRLDDAVGAYERALKLVPQYADAHYNLALALERQGEPRRALRHWRAYVQLDPAGPWSTHAHAQVRRILGSERLMIVARHGRLMRMPR
jgi:tetratricopeptide (TPR) repeat protein